MRSQNKRIFVLDTIRGLMLIWVLIVHISLNYGLIHFGTPNPNNSIFSWLSFFMTPFYITSGYLFTFKDSFLEYLRRKYKKLIIPYFYFSLFGFIVWIIYRSLAEPLSLGDVYRFILSSITTASLPSNTPCWFFFSLFCVNISYFILHLITMKFRFGEKERDAFFVIFFLILSYLTHNKTQFLGDGNICLGLLFFHFGVIFKRYFFNIKLVLKLIVLILSSIIYILIGYFKPEELSFVLNLLIQGNYFLNIIFSICGFIILFYLLGFISNNFLKNSYINYIGYNSLLLFAYHRIVLNWIFDPIIFKISPQIHFLPYLIISLSVILVFYHIFLLLAKKYCPKIIGL